ncbi:septum site-determining protein MinD, partial [Helicobacter fennelliae]
MAEIITITSGKGGVGKSTATANIAVGLAQMQTKVVAIDFDIGLRNLDMILGLENRIVYDVVDVMEGKCNLAQALIQDKKTPTLYFLPASQSKDKNILDKNKVKALIEELKKDFDYILLDSPAGIEGGFEHAIFWADRALIVVTPEV